MSGSPHHVRIKAFHNSPARFPSYLISLSMVKTLSRQKGLTLPFITAPFLLLLIPEEREREMKGTSKVIMGATLVMVVGLAIVLGLVMVLLAELYCSLLLRRRKFQITTASSTAAATTTTTTTTTAIANDSSSLDKQPHDQSTAAPPLRSFYAQGVLRAPRSFLFPAVSDKELETDIEQQQQHSQPLQIPESKTQQPSSTPHRIGLVTPSPSSPSFVASPNLIQKVSLQGDSTSNGGEEHFVYISNPIYDNEAGMASRADTPFETPDTSPSHLEMGGSSGDDKGQSSPSSPSSLPVTPPLSPMKKLPSEACSVSLRDARSLATSGSDSNSNNGASSSSSGSPCTSPSW